MDAEQRARELLAEEYRRLGIYLTAQRISEGLTDVVDDAAISAITRALTQAQPGWRVVPVEEHMELKVNATALCEQMAGLIFSMWMMGDGEDFDYNGVSVAGIVADLRAAETAYEMMAAFDGIAAAPAPQQGEGREVTVYVDGQPFPLNAENPSVTVKAGQSVVVSTHPQEGDGDGRG